MCLSQLCCLSNIPARVSGHLNCLLTGQYLHSGEPGRLGRALRGHDTSQESPWEQWPHETERHIPGPKWAEVWSAPGLLGTSPQSAGLVSGETLGLPSPPPLFPPKLSSGSTLLPPTPRQPLFLHSQEVEAQSPAPREMQLHSDHCQVETLCAALGGVWATTPWKVICCQERCI